MDEFERLALLVPDPERVGELGPDDRTHRTAEDPFGADDEGVVEDPSPLVDEVGDAGEFAHGLLVTAQGRPQRVGVDTGLLGDGGYDYGIEDRERVGNVRSGHGRREAPEGQNGFAASDDETTGFCRGTAHPPPDGADRVTGLTDAVRLLDRTRLRAMLLSLWRDPGPVRREADPDSALVEPTARPYESVDDALERLETLESRLREREDRRAVFLTVYTRMTRAIRANIDRGEFADPAWMRRYTVAFADYYRRAFLAFEHGRLGAVPAPWRIAFDTSVRGAGLVVQDAFLGINAHINYDLALTLLDVGIDPDRPDKRRDHRAVDGVLRGLVDAQQEALVDLYAPGVADIDAKLGRFDESFALLGMTEGREQAWRVAVVATDAGLPPVRSYARWVLRTTATGGAAFVLSPTVDAGVMAKLRRVERRGIDVEEALDRLVDRLDDAVPG